jgi:hypothetical protein
METGERREVSGEWKTAIVCFADAVFLFLLAVADL